MDFNVLTPGEVEDHYHDEATFKVLDSGALHVWPQDERREKQVIYGPAGWSRVTVTSETPPPPPPVRVR